MDRRRMSYADFLALKVTSADKPGREVSTLDVHPMLHGWQKELVQWAVRTSRAAIWADTGLGKTVMQLEWARLSGDTALVVASLAVCEQTVREATKLGIRATYVRHGEQITGPGIWVTNYEMVPHFPADLLDAVVLDESSILKQSNGATRTMLIEHFRPVPHRLACSATPAPNDPEELTTTCSCFASPGDNAVQIKNDVTNDEWIDWASPIWSDVHDGAWLTEDGNICPVWWGIKETATLNTRVAKDSADERHICPLQLGFIERCVRLWSNPGELILTPFAGIGSELWESVRLGRRAVGIELKPSYWRTAVDNMQRLEADMAVPSLFDDLTSA